MNLKITRYLTSVDILEGGRKNKLLFSARTGTLMVMDFHSWQALETGHFELLPQEVLEDLKRKKLLVSKDENEVQTVLDENKKFLEERDDSLYTVIQPTAACPLGCHYCGQAHSNNHLSEENQKNTLQYIAKKLSAKKYKFLNVSWFGGEPLSGMSVINNLSPKIQALAKESGLLYSASIVTNGLLLSQENARKLIHEHQVKSIEITLDGTAEYHDQRRHLKTGGATFLKIYKNLQELAKIKLDDVFISIRCNIDARNKDGVVPLLKQLANDNLEKKIDIYFAQIHSWGNDAHRLAADKTEFARWQIEWFLEMKELGFNSHGIPSRKKKFCIAVTPNHDLVDPYGNIFKCTEVSLVPTYEQNSENIYKVGHVKNKRIDQPERNSVLENFFETDVIKNYACYECSILPVCGGTCPKLWHEGIPPCPPMKYNMKERLLIHYAQSLKEVKYVDTIEEIK